MSRLASLSTLTLFLASGALAGCGSSHEAPLGDAGGDSAVVDTDGGGTGIDASTGVDASTGTDSGADATTGDAGSTDSGTVVPVDAGAVDATAPPADGAMPTIPGSIGAACTADGDCDMLTAPMCMTTLGSGSFSFDFPGGYCTQTCTPSFGGGTDDCPTGSTCFGAGAAGFGAAFCGKTCTSDADCRTSETYTCTAPPFGSGPSVCAPPRGAP